MSARTLRLQSCSSCETSARECHHARNCHQRSERQPMLQISQREVVQVMACCHEGLCAKTLVWVPWNIWQGLDGRCSTMGAGQRCVRCCHPLYRCPNPALGDALLQTCKAQHRVGPQCTVEVLHVAAQTKGPSASPQPGAHSCTMCEALLQE